MPNRLWCQVLDEMRDHLKHLNFSMFPSLIEELQTMGNRMEAALGENSDYRYYSEKLSKLKKEYRKLQEEKEKLEEELGYEEDDRE